jgi:hypothetical protein
MVKDWVGNGYSTFKTIGASNHTEKEREFYDYYATEPKAMELLCDLFQFSPYVWECACGEGHLSKVLEKRGYLVKSTDLIDRGYGKSGVDFLKCETPFPGDIITNPPYKYAQQFVEKALSLVNNGHHVAMFLKLTFMEGKKRKNLFTQSPPKVIYVSSSRLLCAKNGEFQKMMDGGGSAVAYGWYIWEKGYAGKTTLCWFN